MTIFLGILFGAVGGVYLALGRRNHDPMYLVTGFLLLVYPYLFSNAFLIIVIGIALIAFPIARSRGLI